MINLIGFLLFSIVSAQTYVEGDIVGEFGADICQNGDGYWSYQEQGPGKVTFLALFATW
ncbi:MAG: hypothetical protein ACJZ10_06850 [Candidatus Neomarinimicrobiota bacterium]